MKQAKRIFVQHIDTTSATVQTIIKINEKQMSRKHFKRYFILTKDSNLNISEFTNDIQLHLIIIN